MHPSHRSLGLSLRLFSRKGPSYGGLGSVIVATLLVGCGDQFSVAGATGATGTTGSGGAASTSTTSADATATSVSTGGGAATSSGTGGAGSGGGGGDPGVEDCTNGVDDDENGMTDCEDPACEAFLCTEAAPSGWTGPVAFFYGDPAMLPNCDPIWPTSSTPGGGSLNAAQAVCACSCETPQGASCSLPQLTITADAVCLVPTLALNNAGDGVCAGLVSTMYVAGGLTGAAPTPTGGACTPNRDFNIPEAHWEFDGLICEGAPLGLGCEAGKVCAPKPAAPLSPGLCIYKSGTEDCPEGMYAFPTALYEKIEDDRSCSDCSCGDPVKVACSGVTTLYTDLACANETATIVHDEKCNADALALQSYKYVQTGPAGGHCDPAGGKPSGTISASGALTVCCAF